jgi:hypothetical protein
MLFAFSWRQQLRHAEILSSVIAQALAVVTGDLCAVTHLSHERAFTSRARIARSAIIAPMGFVGKLLCWRGVVLVSVMFFGAVPGAATASPMRMLLAQTMESRPTYTPIRGAENPAPAPAPWSPPAAATPATLAPTPWPPSSSMPSSSPPVATPVAPYSPPQAAPAQVQYVPRYVPISPVQPNGNAAAAANGSSLASPPAAAFWPVSPGAVQSTPTSASRTPDASSLTVAKRAVRAAPTKRGVFGLATDVGMPDGLNLGLVLAPAKWLRLAASAGTNSAALGYRGGLSLVPVGWGPSFTFEVGHCNLAEMNSVLRTFFSVSNWVKPYVQQFGYTYLNAHLGLDYPVGNFMLFLHGGYTYLMGTVRGSNPVVVGTNSDAAKTPNMTVTIGQDGEVRAHTLSAKLGIVLMFGGI